MSFYDNEPCDGLRVNELRNGTKCAYCCQGLNPAVYHYPAYCVDDQHWINADDLELLGGGCVFNFIRVQFLLLF